MKYRTYYYSLFVLAFFAACTPITMNQLVNEGRAPLAKTQLQELIPDHTLHLEAIDLDTKVHYLADGRLIGTSLQGETDKGKWTISASDELCMKFDKWYYGDLKCYKLFKEKDQLIFFTSNGARYFTGTLLPGNNGTATSQTSTEESTYIAPSQNAPPAAQLSQTEKKHTLLSLARNCPDCDLAGVDLRGAQLVAANLAGANLAGADLRNANLRRANLAGANLAGAQLSGTSLAGANLTDADLSGADLTGSNLIRANVTGANLKGAVFSGAHLESIQGFKE